MLVVKNLPANAGDVRDMGLIPESRRCPGGGYGNPLQYSCLENPTDRGAWGPTVRSISMSQTQLKWVSTHARARAHTHTHSPSLSLAHISHSWPHDLLPSMLKKTGRYPWCFSVFLHPSIHLFSPQALTQHLGEASGWCWFYTNEQDKHHPYPHGAYHLHRVMDMNQTYKCSL